jgi:D-arabinonate dehydratase/D-galactarolactone cycloisomerase
MKISKVEPIGLFVPMDEPVGAPISLPYADQIASVVFGGYRSTIVKVHTDDGLVGVGECFTRLAPKATVAIIEELAPILIGRDPLDVEGIWEIMYGVMMNRGHRGGFFIEALSGIDVALWDLWGKATGQPVYRLLGGRMRERVWAYASSLRMRGLEVTVAQAREFVDRGFNAMKIKIGKDPYDTASDLRLVEAIRREVGDGVTLMVDANCGYDRDVKQALRVGRALEEYDVFWFEEPLSPDNVDGYCTLTRALDTSIAAGEASFTRYDFRDLFARGAVDIVQPNACRTGGLSEARKIAAMSAAYHIPYAPHTDALLGADHHDGIRAPERGLQLLEPVQCAGYVRLVPDQDRRLQQPSVPLAALVFRPQHLKAPLSQS